MARRLKCPGAILAGLTTLACIVIAIGFYAVRAAVDPLCQNRDAGKV
jgi:hypothetical protein